MNLLLCSTLVGVRLGDADMLLDGVLLVNLRSERRLAIQRSHLVVNVFPVVVWHLHASVKIVER